MNCSYSDTNMNSSTTSNEEPQWLTTKEMLRLEMNSEALGIPTILLMENAGRGVAEVIRGRMGGTVKGKVITALIGKGGKGGDAMAASRHLASWGASVNAVLFGEVNHRDALSNLSIVSELDLSISLYEHYRVGELVKESDVVIDGLLGTGGKGPLREPVKSGVIAFNSAKGLKVSIDIPSGIDPDTGSSYDEVAKPDVIVTMHAPKRGLKGTGTELIVLSIGIPKEAELYTGPGDVVISSTKKPMKNKKGDNGRVLVIAGSDRYAGAAFLSAEASLRTGADLVYLVSTREVAREVRTLSPDIISVEVDDEILKGEDWDLMKEVFMKADSVVLGPGLGTAEETGELVRKVVRETTERGKPLVLDADGIKLAKGTKIGGRTVITPHAGEFRVLFEREASLDLEQRIREVMEASRDSGAVVLLKGYYDVISDGTRFRINKSGQPGMSVGGTGDVLAGIIGKLIIDNEPLVAASAGSYINGIAGSMLYEENGDRIKASQILQVIPRVIKDPISASRNRRYGRIFRDFRRT